ncbi:unnamed protein product [Peniophora sp. CBMAI 1063]|nr:unnamed protein product [Peniophora sp. CBMAI 1063]
MPPAQRPTGPAMPIPSKGKRRGQATGYHEQMTPARAFDTVTQAGRGGIVPLATSSQPTPQTQLEEIERTLPVHMTQQIQAPPAQDIAPLPIESPVETSQSREDTPAIKNHPIVHWIPLRDEYMFAKLRLAGRPGVVVWVNDEWQPTSLRQMGQIINFGHWDGSRCGLVRRSNPKFIVIDTNGIHEISAKFCGCTGTKVPIRDQLLAARMWPSTTENPHTAATFDVLDQFDAHSASGKQNAYDFYNALEALTDPAGLIDIPDRSKTFFRIAHESRHVQLAQRGGRGHDARGGIDKTGRGELAVLCPACPHKGINTDIVDIIRKISPELADAAPIFNDLVQLSTDCNFRAKNKDNRSTLKTSPYLGDGMAYMVPYQPYEDFTSNSAYQEELSNCNRFGALVLANLKAGKGLRTTGIGAVFCSRHEFFWPNSIGTLVKGERYCTMDFIIASTLRRVHVSNLNLYYDIVCQFTRNLHTRMLSVESKSFIYVGSQKILHHLHITFGIPKFHNPGHMISCQLWFNISYIVGAGNTDGEASERAWAGLNPASSSFREMGPGTMRDTMDFFAAAWNWRKTINMGSSLEKKMEVALNEAREHCEIYTGLWQVIRGEDAGLCDEWLGEAVAWEEREILDALGRPIIKGRDAVLNPYESRTQKQSLEKARLASAEIAAKATSDKAPLDGASSKTAAMVNFVLMAFKIEVTQWKVGRSNKNRTLIQKTERLEQRMDLERQIRLFRKEQQWMMPLVYAAIQELEGVDNSRDDTIDEDEDDSGGNNVDVKDMDSKVVGGQLCLPSELDRDVVRTHGLIELACEELKLRWAGMADWLDVLRQQLRVRGTVDKWKTDHVRGQGLSTRARTKQEAIQANVDTAKQMYRHHRERYATLISFLDEDEQRALVPAKWEETFEVLEDRHCKPLTHRILLKMDDEEIKHIKSVVSGEQPSGQTHHKIPWIWYRISAGSKLELNDDLRVEFVKCRARAMRWVEEIFHLAYEMVRVPAFCEARSRWWSSRASVKLDETVEKELMDGVHAYARQQSTMFRRQGKGMRSRFEGSLEKAARFVRYHGLDGLQKIPSAV